MADLPRAERAPGLRDDIVARPALGLVHEQDAVRCLVHRHQLSGAGLRPRWQDGGVEDSTGLQHALIDWFAANARELPWRGAPGEIDAWAVLVSEFMLQQTQVERVLPRFEEWIERWPRPSALAAEAPGEAVRAWGRLGYPRRALWLHRAAGQIARDHGDRVPRDIDALLALTGVGPYTARAVASFAYGERHPVVDTNTRRVIARLVHGRAAAGPPRAGDLDDMAALLPDRPGEAAAFNAAAMELGAVVCTARTPDCGGCAVAAWCEWRGAGYPDNAPARRPTQAAFNGSDRQVRGRIMALLRRADAPVPRSAALTAGTDGGVRDADQPLRALDSLLADGLVVEHDGRYRLP
ncbi:MAG: A/G-specific adenine glycosylase [Leucobacter sp.]|nr:A/G-specific adenine glycosylase [Leucobacter sp.]